MSWLGLILVLILLELSALRRHKDREAAQAEELRKQAEERRVEAHNAEVARIEAERIADEEAKEAAFWAQWNAPFSGGSYWQMRLENGPENFDDEYYDNFDEVFGPEWRRRLEVPPKGGYLQIRVQFQPQETA